MTDSSGTEHHIAFPGEEAYEDATRVFNLAAPAQPSAAVTVHTVADIRRVLEHAAFREMPVRVHTTGHGAGAAPPMAGSVLVRTALADAIEIDAENRIARVPAGTRWGAVVDAAASHGLAAPHGSSPLVSVVGYVLRGGVSSYGRQVGLAANSVRAVELVTADGRLRRVDRSTEPDLFWALRGGGGGFGVVTAVEIGLFPATEVYTGAAFWPAAHAEALTHAWQQWSLHAPEQVTTSLRVMNLPDLPEIPSVLRQGPVLAIDGVVLTDPTDPATARRQVHELQEPLRAVAEPVFDTWEWATPAAVPQTHMDPTEPAPVIGDHMLLQELGEDGVAAFLGTVGEGSDSPLVAAELRQRRGDLAVSHPEGGALDHFTARYAYMAAGVPVVRGTAEEISRHCAVVRKALTPWDTGWTAPTFVEGQDQPRRHLTAGTQDAVARVRAQFDPHGRFAGDVDPQTPLPE